ncbi:HTH-type transcriptional activator RhaS [Paenibacillus plantiphilus]|uniref:HTH-type transcriptional activator RhaS n=1 Tax=Paenibacillus plantiphilus TaxID=2905650 RepID=A0ABM9CFM8_9BACL|nr:AraC family transcriptional regulator [Paenibacillus plantiphilus]CAH1210844.1 HTH-type transcriptional activator RhaS [Paenibacillus plantiphilus]
MGKQAGYTVVSNPVPALHGDLYVLFTGESQTKPNHRIGPKVYGFYLLHHVLAGSGTFTCADQTYTLHAGQSFLIQPDQLISYESHVEAPWHYRWIAFEGRQAEELIASAGLSTEQPIIDTGANRRIGALFRSMERTFRQGGSAAAVQLRSAGYLQLLFAEFSSLPADNSDPSIVAPDNGEALFQQVIRYLSSQYAEPVSIERMASTLGYNRAYLSRLFKQRTGITPVAFLLQLRLDKARLLLRERTELTIEQIASSVGFQDPLYFSKQFRRFYDYSPSGYREAMQRLQFMDKQ